MSHAPFQSILARKRLKRTLVIGITQSLKLNSPYHKLRSGAAFPQTHSRRGFRGGADSRDASRNEYGKYRIRMVFRAQEPKW